jgi:hypothetical protein
MTQTDDDLTPDEREALRTLPREAAPPPRLEDATVAALAGRGLLRPAPRARRIHPGLAAAASLLLFAGGLALGRLGGSATPPADDGRPRFALFLYEGPEYDQPAPGAMEQRVQEYVAWASEEREDVVVEGGEKLREDPDLVVGPGEESEVAPAPEAARLAGYFLVRATSRRAAVQAARTCPHVRYGGRIVVREIDPT